MKFKIFILPFLVFLCFQLNAQKFEDQNFQSAYEEISSMLEGKQPLDFERAVFLTENAYRDNSIAYKDFQATLDISTEIIQQLIKANDGQDWRQYVRGTKVTPERELQVKERYQRALANWAIYTWMTDTVEVKLNGQNFSHLPLNYSNDDPFGTADWKNSQMLNLLESGKGNCYALATLFKIFSERLKSGARIVTAPQHIYIEHLDPNGNRFNVELPTRSFPNMGSIQTLTYTTREGLFNDISMRSLDLRQSVGLSLIYLAKGYQYRYRANNNEFLLTCANKVLEHDPKNLNALLLKAEVYEQRVMNHRMDASIYESLLTDLYKLGYRQMPDDMREVILSRIQGRQPTAKLADKSPNPYQSINEQSRYVTLSNGLFDEVHQSQKIVKYGRTIFDNEKKKVVRFLDEDISSYQVDPVVFALSVDPLTSQYAELTPYQFASNKPINSIDLDGLESRTSIQGKFINGYWTMGSDNHISLASEAELRRQASEAMKNKPISPNYGTLRNNDITSTPQYQFQKSMMDTYGDFVMPYDLMKKYAAGEEISALDVGIEVVSMIPIGKFSKLLKYSDDASDLIRASRRLSPCGCFDGSTLVVSDKGLIAIDQIKIGNNVLSWNETDHQKKFKKVIDVFTHTRDTLYHISIEGESINVTSDHPIYLGNKWVKAENIRVGDRIEVTAGKLAEVQSIQLEFGQFTVYNFTVEDFHTYYVTRQNILVHNGTCDVSFGKNMIDKFGKHSAEIIAAARKNGIKLPKGVSKEATQEAFKDYITTAVRNGESYSADYMTLGQSIWTKYGDSIIIRNTAGEFITHLTTATKQGQETLKYWNDVVSKSTNAVPLTK